MKKVVTTIFFIGLLPIASLPAIAQAPKSTSAQQIPKNANITYKIIPSSNNTFGYDILVDGRVTIHQPTIPGMAGNQGFKTKIGAISVAQLIIDKMKKGMMPPPVTVEDMKTLKAI